MINFHAETPRIDSQQRGGIGLSGGRAPCAEVWVGSARSRRKSTAWVKR